MHHFHWWYIPVGFWLYLFIGARLFRGEFLEATDMWNPEARLRAFVLIVFWPFVDIVRVFVED